MGCPFLVDVGKEGGFIGLIHPQPDHNPVAMAPVLEDKNRRLVLARQPEQQAQIPAVIGEADQREALLG